MTHADPSLRERGEAAGPTRRVLEEDGVEQALAGRPWRLLGAVVLTVIVLFLAMDGFSFPGNRWVQAALTALVLFLAGGTSWRGAMHALARFRADMNVLVAMGTGAAFISSLAATIHPRWWQEAGHEPHVYYEVAAFITTMVLLGRYLEERARCGAGHPVRRLPGPQPRSARLVDEVSAWFVPAVIVVALAAGLGWYWLGPEPALAHALLVFVSVVIISCPCAVGLATPAALVAGLGRAADQGVLFRRAEAIEVAGKVQRVVVDKTGTLTEGRPSVTHVACRGGWTEARLLELAAAVEMGSTHPVALAILDEALRRGLESSEPDHCFAYDDFGVEGTVDGRDVLIGNRSFFSERGMELGEFETQWTGFEQKGQSVVVVGIDGRIAGWMSVADRLRPQARVAVERLQAGGLEVAILTGDRRPAALRVAQQLNIEHFEAELLPEEKAQRIRAWQAEGTVVAMLGDGINDAPALAAADVGVVLAGEKDIALETGDVILMGDSPGSLMDAVNLSRQMVRTIRQNLLLAFGYNVLCIPLAAGLFHALSGWMLSPMVASTAMALSSVSVVANSVRLRRG